MLTDMETNFKILKDNNQSPQKFCKILLEALINGPNHTFNGFIQRMIDDTESGIGSMSNITAGEVIAASRARYNSMVMVTKKLWNKVDPRDAQLMALTTQLVELKMQQNDAAALATSSNPNPPKGNDRKTDENFIDGVARWRTVKEGDMEVVDGRTYNWCPHHVHSEGHWNRLYYTHQPACCYKNPNRATSNNSTNNQRT